MKPKIYVIHADDGATLATSIVHAQRDATARVDQLGGADAAIVIATPGLVGHTDDIAFRRPYSFQIATDYILTTPRFANRVLTVAANTVDVERIPWILRKLWFIDSARPTIDVPAIHLYIGHAIKAWTGAEPTAGNRRTQVARRKQATRRR